MIYYESWKIITRFLFFYNYNSSTILLICSTASPEPPFLTKNTITPIIPTKAPTIMIIGIKSGISAGGVPPFVEGGAYFLTWTVALASLPMLSLTKNWKIIISPSERGVQIDVHIVWFIVPVLYRSLWSGKKKLWKME